MKLVVGTKNPAKVHAVQEAFIREPFTVISMDVPSEVSAQPFSDEETMQGAINRAKASIEMIPDAILGLGLEGGVTETSLGLMLCNWGALVHRSGQIWVASGAKLPLPTEIAKALQHGEELGDVMARLTTDKDIRKKEGAVGVLTGGRMTRKNMFSHIVQLLYGQYQFEYKEFKH
ncbi:DUF84 family protein [Halalkalibacter urbisdiaboli]|uniref:DUF84 family protein n=1 Tax=Halalkalibacter urbisdiaboli TaxID=1960589 RepID=UPI000B4505DF|nr:DUF84 family protein [Halalkalibacter urbisdiaboli]